MKKPKDCTVIEGDEKVVISKTTADSALDAMKECARNGKYRELLADDASFIRAAMAELAKASI